MKSLQRLQRYQHWHSASASSSFTRTQHRQQYEPTESPIHYCDHAALYSDDNSTSASASAIGFAQELPTQPTIRCSTSSQSNLNVMLAEGGVAIETEEEEEEDEQEADQQQEQLQDDDEHLTLTAPDDAVASGSGVGQRLHATAAASFNHQLTADMCNFKNSKSRRLEYSLKCLKYGRSNPSQDSAFGSLTDNDLSIGSSSIRLSSFQSISSPIDEGVFNCSTMAASNTAFINTHIYSQSHTHAYS